MTEQQLHPSQYTIGWISALPVELAAVQELLDEKHEAPSRGSFGTNIYTVGRIAGHNVAIAALPFTQIGPSPAAWVAAQMKVTFPNIQVTLMVGVGGGAPREGVDVRLGDVVIGRPNQAHGGIVQYDSGKATTNGFQRTGFLNNPPSILLKAITQLEASHLRGQEVHMEYLSQLSQQFCRDRAGPDVLFRANYDHVDGETCAQCDKANSIARPPRDKEVMIHYGTIASGNKVMKNGRERDRISHELGGVMCFEMEAAGLVNDLPCLVIRGICDYADSHKNKSWQGYASATAAACAKALLFMTPKIPPSCDSPIQQRHHFARKRRLKCLTWLSCSAYRRTHQRILRAIIPCTSTWLLSRHEFMRWKNEQHSALFWLQGPTGYGKTSIASTIINQFSREIDEDSTKMLNYFYCSNNNADQYPTSIVSTFLHQLLSRLPLGYNAIEKEYEHWAIRDIDRESVHFEELWSLFRAETTQYQKIYVIIDGLDEIDPTGRAQLLNAANNLLSECKTQYKILISSQIFPEISLLEKYEQWIIRPSDNEDDVRKLVHMRTEKNGQLAFLGRDISPDTKQYIRHALVQRACGMLLWARLQLNQLDHATTEHEMMSLIDVFPTDLSTSYRRLWDRVNQQQGSRRILAHAVLELLTFAQQPIKLDSMKRVLEQKTQVAGLYSDDINLGLILHACQGMVVYDERLDIFHLVHRSAHHFLEKTLDGQLAHTWLAEVCLQELLHFPSRSLSIPDNVDIWTADAVFIDTSLELALYAATSWYYHSHNCTPTLQCPEAVSAFLTNETALRLWIRLLDASDGVHNSKLRTLLGFLRAYPRTIDRLFLVSCFFGFDTLFTSALVSREISIGDDIILPSFDHIRRCISWVDQFREITGLEEIAEQYSGLTEDEAKEILEHSYHSNSLEYLFDISRLLGDVRCAGAICAAEQGHERIIKKLLEDLLMRNTLSVSQHDYLIFSCLRLASAGRHLSVLETIGASDLILWGHRTVPFSFVEGSMLGLSAFLGSREMLLYWKQKMVYLEEHIPLADLSFAVKRDDERATKLLLENFQVDINHRRVHPDWPFFREENTPLLVAAREGYHRVVEALLRHPEIDVNARDDFGNTALMRPGSNLVVAALCRHKHLNIHLRNQLGETALYYFIKTGSAGAIREMAKRPDFNVNERSYWRETPLIAAVRLGYDEVVRVLMRVPSIDLDACDEDGLNALDFADRAGHGFLRRLLSTHTDTTTETLEDCMENLSVALIRHPRSRT